MNKKLPYRGRLLVQGRSAVYHCVSRTAFKEFVFEDQEREAFTQILVKQAGFCGVELLAYCMMSNHFHVMVRVPEKVPLGDAELLRRYGILYGKGHCPFSSPRPESLAAMLAANDEVSEYWRRRLQARMHDLNVFMRELKQRFGIWYNHRHENEGTLWGDRFGSVVVEDEPRALSVVAAYIDLNPVRAGMVKDPGEYRHSGYGRAMGGSDWSGLRSYRHLRVRPVG
jgi:putative transposase